MATDLLASIRSELEARLAELRPLLPEYERLLAAADALDTGAADTTTLPAADDDVNRTPAKAIPVRTFPAKPSSAKAAGAKAKRTSHRRPGPRGSAAGTLRRAASEAPEQATPVAIEQAADGNSVELESKDKQKRQRAAKQQRGPRAATQKAILAALDHGSHTPSELVTVTALTSAHIRTHLARLLEEQSITKINRDGKTAYELPSGAAGK